MRVIFAGTPEFACAALRRLWESGADIALVLTQPDRPAGRGMKLQQSPVKAFAREHGIDVVQPRSLRLDGSYPTDAATARERIAKASAQVMVVAAYGLILPQWVLDQMRAPLADGAAGLGCINIHASLLPRWRGAAPIHRAIEAGDTETGITIMQMDAGLDTGDILLAQSLPIQHSAPGADTTGTLHDKLAALGAELVVRALELGAAGELAGRPQPLSGASYAHKVEKAQAQIDWAASAVQIERQVRAFNPAPGAWTVLGEDVVKLWRCEIGAEPVGTGMPVGTVLAVDPGGITVACGHGTLRMCELQRAGARRMDAAAFARGLALKPGVRFGRDTARA